MAPDRRPPPCDVQDTGWSWTFQLSLPSQPLSPDPHLLGLHYRNPALIQLGLTMLGWSMFPTYSASGWEWPLCLQPQVRGTLFPDCQHYFLTSPGPKEKKQGEVPEEGADK